jgi:YebC/PmpR family DNA-binding regulatory protein
MAGHNKWSKIKRQKAAADKKKGKIWARLSRDIAVAAREGGGDPEMNASLAQAIDKAKEENMPKDNIERAIKRGTGELEGQDYEEALYEGYAPHGVAVLIETLTDNTNRTVADLRHLFDKAGGSLGKSGSVSYLFERKGRITLPVEGRDELELFELVVDAGAEDLEKADEQFIVTTPVEAFDTVERALKEANEPIDEAKLAYLPVTTVAPDPDAAQKIASFLETLDEQQDVQEFYTTLDDDAVPAEEPA